MPEEDVMGAIATGARPRSAYARFAELDGSHPFKEAVPGGFVDYAARRRRDGEVAYFDFALAKEMGLIPPGHPSRLDPALARAILDAFCFVIVNEWDLAHGVRVPPRDLMPGRYMATRYLQLQHPDRRGTTSGDGRSVWVGAVTHGGTTWDVSACGTGVTCLSPGTVELGRFLRTGNDVASYGCGTAALRDGFAAALMSRGFHRAGIPTERTLALIALPKGQAIVVRAGRNLLRPAHLFAPLKQGDLPRLRAVAAYAAARQAGNGDAPSRISPAARWRGMARDAARAFGRMAATFEREYVFCWLDWDGDNILIDGGIIDYGSVRQFGLYHRSYRFDDGPRWSTTLPEQRAKARYIVQCFVQARDFLITGRKPPLAACAADPVLGLFEREYRDTRDRLLLRRAGFPDDVAALLARRARPLIARFDRAHAFFERARSTRGPVKVPDGLTWNAIFAVRDLLRELPRLWLDRTAPVPPEVFLRIGASSYASRRDRRATPRRRAKALEFQRALLALVRRGAALGRRSEGSLLREIAGRSGLVNRYARLTGDASTYAAARLARHRRGLGAERLSRVIERCVEELVTRATPRTEPGKTAPEDPDVRRTLDALMALAEECRHGI